MQKPNSLRTPSARLLLNVAPGSSPWVVILILLSLVGCQENGQSFQKNDQQPRPGASHYPPLRDTWPPRAVWVLCQAYQSPEQIAALMERIQQLGLNTVLFQVRRNATAFYRSRIEPLDSAYAAGDPGFDPLAVACDQAHRRGLALHAWVNVMPAWRGERPPNDSRQLYHAHPEWFWYDQHGRRQPLSDFYVSINPCLPEVRAYLVEVFREIVQNYSVDGLHLDYIRFPTDRCPKGSDYPHDARTLALYRQTTGRRPRDDAARWSNWRAEQVTQLVREIREMVGQVRPSAKLTATCGPNIDESRRYHFQDGPAWVRQGLLDRVFVMNYSADTRTFRLRQEAWQRAVGGRALAVGIGLYLHDADRISIDQLALARQWGGGFGLFSANCLFDDGPRSARRLQAIGPELLRMRPAAVGQVWLDDRSTATSGGAAMMPMVR